MVALPEAPQAGTGPRAQELLPPSAPSAVHGEGREEGNGESDDKGQERATLRLERQGSCHYDDAYPTQLEGVMGREQWDEALGMINEALRMRMPCGPARWSAYLCCPCSCGVSLFSYISQLREANRGASEVIGFVNTRLRTRGVEVEYCLRQGSGLLAAAPTCMEVRYLPPRSPPGGVVPGGEVISTER